MSKEQKSVYKLTDVNIVNKTGTLHAKEEGKRAWIKMQVELSGQLVSLINKGRSDADARQYEDVEFTSTLHSTSFEDNPLKLVQFNNPDGSLKNYQVKLVTDRGFDLVHDYDVFRRKISKPIYKYFDKYHFKRFVIVNLKQ